MIFLTSIPKSGTHLLATTIQVLTGSYPVTVNKPASPVGADFSRFDMHPNLGGHFRREYVSQNASLAVLFRKRSVFVLIRDPRDICNSMVHYLESSDNAGHKSILPLFEGLTLTEKIKAVAAGMVSPDSGYRVPGLKVACGGFIDFGEVIPTATIIRYEDFFIGTLAAEKISAALGVDVATAQQAVEQALGTKTRTLRVGMPQAWRTNFDQSLISYMNSNYGLLIHKLGYRLR
jgi:hypothetical protein